MSNYFYDMLPKDELSQLKYIPTISEFTEWIENKWAEKPALCDTVNTFTYKEMCSHIARRRTTLASKGLGKGDIVAIWEKTSIDAAESFLAVTSAGCIAVLLPTQLPAQAVVGCCAKFGAKALIVRDEFATQTEGVKCTVISSKEMADTPTAATPVDKNDPAAIFFTGGTTGAPKGAILPHRAIMRGSFNGCFAPGSQLGWHRIICFLPLSHVFGLIRSTMSAFYTGSTWYPAEDIKATIGKLPAIKPTLLVLVPGLCEVLSGLCRMYGANFLGGELKTIIAGAANVPPRLIKEFAGYGIRLLAGYGLTESANLTTGNADVETHPTSIGKVYPEQEVKIVDGEIWIKGDNVFLGYAGQPELTDACITPDGWLKTGDLGRIDEDGFIYITGRIKNLIILANGENVSPESIEEPFYKCDALKDCLVKEEKTADGESVIAIEILPRPDAVAGKTPAEIEEYFKNVVFEVNQSLPTTHRVKKVTIRTEDFKRSGAMKVLRNQ